MLYFGICVASTYLYVGCCCDTNGNFLPPDTPPMAHSLTEWGDWTPFDDQFSFELADLVYWRMQVASTHIDDLLQIWAARDTDGPFASVNHLYDTIDEIEVGDVPWQSFTVSYNGEIGENDMKWKRAAYDVWFRDSKEVLKQQLGNPGFKNEMDFAPKKVFDVKTHDRCYQDLMSGNWAWRQAVCIAHHVIDFF